MGVELLTVVAAVRPGEEEAVRAALTAMDDSGESPFAAVAGTHIARFVVLTRLGTGDPVRRKRLHPARLLFSAVVDGPAEVWLGGLFDRAAPALDGIWRHCRDWPEPGVSHERRVRWLLDRRLAVTHAVVAHDVTVAGVRQALARRTALRDVVSGPVGRSPAELRAAYRRAMAGVAL